jgi:hypothetical protein
MKKEIYFYLGFRVIMEFSPLPIARDRIPGGLHLIVVMGWGEGMMGDQSCT